MTGSTIDKAPPAGHAHRARADDAIAALPSELAPRAKSLIVTFLGDMLCEHGGSIWLGSLIGLMAPFGINERLVRTSVLRLSREDWLVAKAVGRRSYYRLTKAGRTRIRDSGRRIYGAPKPAWDGQWHVVLTGHGAIDAEVRAQLRRELLWLGYGGIAPNVYAHPNADADALRNALSALGVARQIVVMRAHGEPLFGAEPDYTLLRTAWNLDALGDAYKGFVARFAPLVAMLDETPIEPRSAFILRLLAMHEFRRAVLRDPGLPRELLPADWAGDAARELVRRLLGWVAEASEAHILSNAETEGGPLPPVDPSFFERFGGLRDDAGSRAS